MDFEAQEFQIKTNSALDSNECITVFFLNEAIKMESYITILFGNPIVYALAYCSVSGTGFSNDEYQNFDRAPTTEIEKTWRITEKADHSTLYIYCNDELVLTYVYADSPHQPGCNNFAAADIEGVKFYYDEENNLSDTASQKYKIVGKGFCVLCFLVEQFVLRLANFVVLSFSI